MRIWWLALLGLVIAHSSAIAKSYQQTVAIQQADLYGEPIKLPEADRDHLVSKGQEYLREIARREMMEMVGRSWINQAWFYIDPDRSLAGLEATVGSSQGSSWLPADTLIRVLADEDIQEYLDCGWKLPIELELESAYQVTKQLRLNAKFAAPFDDALRVDLGSKIQWTSMVESHVNYHFCAANHADNGLTMGIGFQLDLWQLNFKYDVVSDYTALHYLSIARSF